MVLMLMLRSIYIVSVGLIVAIPLMSVDLVASCWPAATVGNVPTVLSVEMSGLVVYCVYWCILCALYLLVS